MDLCHRRCAVFCCSRSGPHVDARRGAHPAFARRAPLCEQSRGHPFGCHRRLTRSAAGSARTRSRCANTRGGGRSSQRQRPLSLCHDAGAQVWRGNRETRTGLVVVLATGDRSYQFLTGNGLEGTLPDGLIQQIEDRIFLPRLRRAQWDEAMLAAMSAVDRACRNDGDLRVANLDDTRHALAVVLASCWASRSEPTIICVGSPNARRFVRVADRKRCGGWAIAVSISRATGNGCPSAASFWNAAAAVTATKSSLKTAIPTTADSARWGPPSYSAVYCAEVAPATGAGAARAGVTAAEALAAAVRADDSEATFRFRRNPMTAPHSLYI